MGQCELDKQCPRPLSGPIASAFILLITELLKRKTGIGSISVYPTDSSDKLYNNVMDTFDFVIIGGGTAGSVLANRLSRIEHFSVLVLEAGDYPSPSSDPPGLFLTLRKSKEDWNYTVEPNSNFCQGTTNKVCSLTFGKSLGGNSLLLHGHHIRANYNDYTKWLKDNLGEYWTREKIDTFQESLEEYISAKPQPIVYGNSGEIHLSHYNAHHPVKDAIIEGGEELMFGRMQFGESLGYMEALGTVINGTKINSARAFLGPIKDRKNLYLSLNSFAQKLIFTNPRDMKIGAVDVKIKDKVVRIKARKEILVCAGVVNSPKLLMLSGIGPKEVLDRHGIKVMSDIPVGRNLQDHFSGFIPVTLEPDLAPNVRSSNFLDAIYDYITKRGGEFHKLNILDLVGFINTHFAHIYPNVAINHFYFERDSYLLRNYFQFSSYVKPTVDSILNANKKYPVIFFEPLLLTPDSVGYVDLKSTNPDDPPAIYANYLAEDRDLHRHLKAYRYIERLINTKSMQVLGAKLLDFQIPYCKKYKFKSDAYVNCTMKAVGFSKSHMIGTTKMGNWYDSCTVVGNTLSVKGCQGLRVIGSSVIPYHISCNTIATVGMIAARVSEIILQKWVPGYIIDATVFTPGEDIC